MNYGQIFDCDVANGPGLRVSLFVSGCTHHCDGCFNPETWDFAYGKPYAEDVQQEVLDKLSRPYIAGLTILGGEPMEPANQRALLPLLKAVRKTMPSKTVWVYSGYTFEELTAETARCRCEVTDEFLSLVDVLVDGEFVLGQKDITLKFRGSRNQRVLNVSASLRSGRPEWIPEYK